jgi:hypothetical protein
VRIAKKTISHAAGGASVQSKVNVSLAKLTRSASAKPVGLAPASVFDVKIFVRSTYLEATEVAALSVSPAHRENRAEDDVPAPQELRAFAWMLLEVVVEKLPRSTVDGVKPTPVTADVPLEVGALNDPNFHDPPLMAT